MAKQANRKLIGGFVVIAVGILAASVVIFGSGDFFKEKREFVMYFEGSVKGLSVGSPVLFQGVQVGVVKRIVIRSYLKEQKAYIPVFIEVYPENFQIVGDPAKVKDRRENWKERLPELIQRGLRAQLVTQSLITGQLAIEMSEYPDTPIELKHLDRDYPEIPTIPSTTQRLVKALEKIDLEEIDRKLQSILSGLDKLVNNPELAGSMTELKGLLQDARSTVENLNGRIGPLTENLNGTLSEARQLLNDVDGELKPLADNVNKTLQDFSELARDADALLEGSLAYELENTLKSLSEAARSLQLLSEYLKRHPESLLKGKDGSGGK